MGYLTTITIYNDRCNELTRHPKELAEKLYNACSGVQLAIGRDYDSLGSQCDLLILQKPRHADDNTLYLHAGNTVVDVYNANSEWAIDAFLSEMKYHTKRLKQLKQELKNNERK